MKPLSFIATAILLSTIPLHAAPRVFTSTDGRTISAELVAATGLQATLKLSDGRETVVPMNRLSQADQDFINGWIKQNPGAIRYSFEVDATKDKVDSKATGSGSSVVTATATKWLYHVKVTNRASQPVDGLQMRYQIHYTDVEGKAKSDEFKSGAKAIPALKPGESTTVDTDPVELVKTQLEGGYIYANGARSRQSDTIKGVVVTIEHNGRSVHEFTSSTSVKKVPESSAPSASSKKANSSR